MIILGIDPGVTTGLALYEGGELTALENTCPGRYEAVLTRFKIDLAVVEDSRAESHVFTGPDLYGRKKNKVARNVGMIDGFCYILEKQCQSLGIKHLPVSPLRKGSKLDKSQFTVITGWRGASNQHQRDAAMVAWPYRRGVQ